MAPLNLCLGMFYDCMFEIIFLTPAYIIQVLFIFRVFHLYHNPLNTSALSLKAHYNRFSLIAPHIGAHCLCCCSLSQALVHCCLIFNYTSVNCFSLTFHIYTRCWTYCDGDGACTHAIIVPRFLPLTLWIVYCPDYWLFTSSKARLLWF